MAAPQVITGTLRDELGNALANCYYRAYFLRRIYDSSSPKWHDTARQASGVGFFSFALDDGDLLGPVGTAQAGDQVLVAAWTPGSDETSNALTRFSWVVVTLTSAPVYNQGTVEVLDNRSPTPSFTLPASATRLASVTLTNDSSDAATSGASTQDDIFTPTGLLPAPSVYPLVFPVTVFPNSAGIDHCDVTWGDGNTSVLTGTGNGSHTYTDNGGTTRTVTLTATDNLGVVSSPTTDSIDIYWRAPVPGGSFGTATVGSSVTFTPSITNSDGDSNVPVTVDYTPDQGAAQTGKGRTEAVGFTFSTSGNHSIDMTVHWNNGFVDTTVTQTFTVNVAALPTTPGTNEFVFFASEEEVFRGEPWSKKYDFLDQDVSGWTLRFMARQYPEATSYQMASRIVAWDDATKGTFTLSLTTADTVAVGRYYGDLQIERNAEVITLGRIVFLIQQDVLR